MKPSTRRRSFKTKQPQPKANFYNPLVRHRPTAYVRNGIIGGGNGPGADGLYQIDDRVYTTSKMFLRDGYMYPRQPGQSMDPRFPLELHEFPQQLGAAGLQLVSTPKVHIAGEYLASEQAPTQEQTQEQQAAADRRCVRQAAAADINLANQVYWLGKQRSRSRSRSRSNSLGSKSITSCIGGGTLSAREQERDRDRPYIRNVDDLLHALGRHDASTDNQHETASIQSSSTQRRRFKKVSFNRVINQASNGICQATL
ncbi:GH22458 [Drosophila grimshawi]|uniref:GH22458 n=1 Tax=Drosophila grimshawi TaxID=7222 RepID=B4JTI8_DROGR|nr:GH22458 [Drosophila grimshawi]